MAKDVDYGRWIATAIDNDPRLSRSGLSRHLNHGNDRGRVIRMIQGKRKIRASEVAQIAAYLGVPPPDQAVPGVASITTAQVIDPGIWLESTATPPTVSVNVPVCPDPRWPAHTQSAYVIRADYPAHGIVSGACLLTVPQTASSLAPDRLVVGQRERAGLTQLTLGVSARDRSTVAVRALLTPRTTESITPIGLVIAVYRTLIP